MGRGLDGFFLLPQGVRYPLWRCAVLKDRGRRGLSPFSGGFGEGETPLPIPNRAVKPLSADGTWLARAWESRTPPVFSIRGPPSGGPSSFPAPRARANRVARALAAPWATPGDDGARRDARRTCALRRVARLRLRVARSPARPSPRERRGRCRPAARAAAGPGAGARGARAAAPGADDRHGPARPGRPPSRRRSRPRAAGRSGRGQAHRARAAARSMSSMRGTCVRKIGGPSDGAVRTCVRIAPRAGIWLCRAGFAACARCKRSCSEARAGRAARLAAGGPSRGMRGRDSNSSREMAVTLARRRPAGL